MIIKAYQNKTWTDAAQIPAQYDRLLVWATFDEDDLEPLYAMAPLFQDAEFLSDPASYIRFSIHDAYLKLHTMHFVDTDPSTSTHTQVIMRGRNFKHFEFQSFVSKMTLVYMSSKALVILTHAAAQQELLQRISSLTIDPIVYLAEFINLYLFKSYWNTFYQLREYDGRIVQTQHKYDYHSMKQLMDGIDFVKRCIVQWRNHLNRINNILSFLAMHQRIDINLITDPDLTVLGTEAKDDPCACSDKTYVSLSSHFIHQGCQPNSQIFQTPVCLLRDPEACKASNTYTHSLANGKHLDYKVCKNESQTQVSLDVKRAIDTLQATCDKLRTEETLLSTEVQNTYDIALQHTQYLHTILQRVLTIVATIFLPLGLFMSVISFGFSYKGKTPLYIIVIVLCILVLLISLTFYKDFAFFLRNKV